MLDFGRRLNDWFGKMNMFQLSFLFGRLLGRSREDLGPFLLLFNLPGTFFSLPMRGAIVPEMKIHIKTRSCDVTESINMEPNLLGENQETEVVVAEKFDMKI